MQIKVAKIIFSVMISICFLAGPSYAKTLKLGVNLPLTGPFANFGVGMYNSFKLAIDQGNASGKLKDLKLEVVPGDNTGDVAQGVSIANKEGSDPNVIGSFCCWVSGIGIATHGIYNRFELPGNPRWIQ